jgi:hypothetical protein
MTGKKKQVYATIAIQPALHTKLKTLAKDNYQTIGGYLQKIIDREWNVREPKMSKLPH